MATARPPCHSLRQRSHDFEHRPRGDPDESPGGRCSKQDPNNVTLDGEIQAGYRENSENIEFSCKNPLGEVLLTSDEKDQGQLKVIDLGTSGKNNEFIISNLTKRVNSYQRTCKRLKSAVEREKAKLLVASNEATRMKSSLQNALNEIDVLNQRIRRMGEQDERWKSQFDSLQRAFQQRQLQHAKEISCIRSEFAKTLDRIKFNGGFIESETPPEPTGEIGKILEKIESLTSENEELKARNKSLSSKNVKLLKRFENIKSIFSRKGPLSIGGEACLEITHVNEIEACGFDGRNEETTIQSSLFNGSSEIEAKTVFKHTSVQPNEKSSISLNSLLNRTESDDLQAKTDDSIEFAKSDGEKQTEEGSDEDSTYKSLFDAQQRLINKVQEFQKSYAMLDADQTPAGGDEGANSDKITKLEEENSTLKDHIKVLRTAYQRELTERCIEKMDAEKA